MSSAEKPAAPLHDQTSTTSESSKPRESSSLEESKDAKRPTATDSTPDTAKSSAAPTFAGVAPPKYEKRKKVMYKDRVVYEWDQDLEEVNIYIKTPPGVRAKQLDVKITVNHLAVGIKGNPPYLNEDLGGVADVSASIWEFADGELHIQLQKAHVAETWTCALKGAELNPIEAQQVQQNILLERFQREHPGFDFSGASFSGAAPDPRTFMGGFDSTKL